MLPVAVTVDVQLVLCLDGEVMSVELAKKHSNSGDPAPRRPDVDDMNCATRRSWQVQHASSYEGPNISPWMWGNG